MAKKILAVDDDPAVLDMLTLRLRHAGYEVATAATGEEALQKLRASGAAVVLLDVMLPGMHGYEVCQAIRADRALDGVKIIFISAKSFASDIKTSKRLGAADFLVKPFETKDLLEAIERATGAPDDGAAKTA